MFKSCRILNKNTNEDFYGQLDLELLEVSPLVEVPREFNGKPVEWKDGQIQVAVKPIDLRDLDYIQTSIGRLKKVTPVGDLPTVMNSLFNLVNIAGILPAGTLRFYREDDTYFYNADMTKEEFTGLYLEFIQAYKALDTAI